MDLWTGREVRALRAAMRDSLIAFAERLGVTARMVSNWEARGTSIKPRAANQEALDRLLQLADEDVLTRFTRALRQESGDRQQAAVAANIEQTGEPDSVSSVIQLARSDVERRGFLAVSAAYSIAALGLPDPEALLRRTRAAAAGARVNVGLGEVEAIRRMTTSLGDAASEVGGGHARHLAVRYLATDVDPWLRGNYTQAVGRELFRRTSELAQLVGWMAGDAGLPGLAQRYYAHSYRLATESGDNETAATALRGMTMLHIDAGPAHRATAVTLAAHALKLGGNLTEPRAVAYYQTTMAEAAALDGDGRRARECLSASERAIEQAPAVPGESWAGHFSPGRWAHATGMILGRLGDAEAGAAHLRHALNSYGIDRQRSRAMVLADLAGMYARLGDRETAMATWSEFCDAAAGVRSVRITEAAEDMLARLALMPPSQAASRLTERASALNSGIE